MNITNQFDAKFGLVNSWNNTYKKKAIIIYPSNLDNLKKLINKTYNKPKESYRFRCIYTIHRKDGRNTLWWQNRYEI